MNKEYVERFFKYEVKHMGQYSKHPFYLSDDATLGLLKEIDETKWIEFGSFKMKKRVKQYIRVTDKLVLNPRLLYRALKILRRRSKFTFGLYYLREEEGVFGLRERDTILLIAPTLPYPPTEIIDFKDFVVYYPEEKIKEIKFWMRLEGRKI